MFVTHSTDKQNKANITTTKQQKNIWEKHDLWCDQKIFIGRKFPCFCERQLKWSNQAKHSLERAQEIIFVPLLQMIVVFVNIIIHEIDRSNSKNNNKIIRRWKNGIEVTWKEEKLFYSLYYYLDLMNVHIFYFFLRWNDCWIDK